MIVIFGSLKKNWTWQCEHKNSFGDHNSPEFLFRPIHNSLNLNQLLNQEICTQVRIRMPDVFRHLEVGLRRIYLANKTLGFLNHNRYWGPVQLSACPNRSCFHRKTSLFLLGFGIQSNNAIFKNLNKSILLFTGAVSWKARKSRRRMLDGLPTWCEIY